MTYKFRYSPINPDDIEDMFYGIASENGIILKILNYKENDINCVGIIYQIKDDYKLGMEVRSNEG